MNTIKTIVNNIFNVLKHKDNFESLNAIIYKYIIYKYKHNCTGFIAMSNTI